MVVLEKNKSYLCNIFAKVRFNHKEISLIGNAI